MENRYPSASSNYEWGRYKQECGIRRRGFMWFSQERTHSIPVGVILENKERSWIEPNAHIFLLAAAHSLDYSSTDAHHQMAQRDDAQKKKNKNKMSRSKYESFFFFYIYRPSLFNFKSFTICKFFFCMVFITFVHEFLVRGTECWLESSIRISLFFFLWRIEEDNWGKHNTRSNRLIIKWGSKQKIIFYSRFKWFQIYIMTRLLLFFR